MMRPLLKPTSVDPHTGLAVAKMRFAGHDPMFFAPETTA